MGEKLLAPLRGPVCHEVLPRLFSCARLAGRSWPLCHAPVYTGHPRPHPECPVPLSATVSSPQRKCTEPS